MNTILQRIFLSLFLMIAIGLYVLPGTVQAQAPFKAGRLLTDGEILYCSHENREFIGYDIEKNSHKGNILMDSRPDVISVEGGDEMVLANLNGVGRDEIIFGDASEDKIRIFMILSAHELAEHYGIESLASQNKPIEVGWFKVKFDSWDDLDIGDVDGDGNQEIIIADASSNKLLIFGPNKSLNGNGPDDEWKYSLKYSFDFGYEGSERIAVGDLDNDGQDEIVHGNSSSNATKRNIYVYKLNTSFNELSLQDKFFVNWTKKEELAIADIDNDGSEEIIVGCGNTENESQLGGDNTNANDIRHRIAVFDGETFQLKALSQDIGFKGLDGLAAGDLDMDGRAEIVVGSVDNGCLHVYRVELDKITKIAELPAGYQRKKKWTYVPDYDDPKSLLEQPVYKWVLYKDTSDRKYDGEKIAIGDLDGHSITVGKPIYKCRKKITQPQLEIHPPPQSEFFDENHRPPFLRLQYNYVEQQTYLKDVTAIVGCAFSTKVEAELNLKVVKASASLEVKYNSNLKKESGQAQTTSSSSTHTLVDQGMISGTTTTFDLYEYPILDEAGSHKVLEDGGHYLLVSVPVDIFNSDELFEEERSIFDYPSDVSQLVHYKEENRFIDDGYDTELVISCSHDNFGWSMEKSSFESETNSSMIGVAATTSVSSSILGIAKFKASFAGKYESETIRTHMVKFSETTSLLVEYSDEELTNLPRWCTEEPSDHRSVYAYTPKLIGYYDSEDGHMIFDWLVTSCGYEYQPKIDPEFDTRFGRDYESIASSKNKNLELLQSRLSMPLPAGQEFFAYAFDDLNQGCPVLSIFPADCKPLGFVLADESVDLQIDLPRFKEPMDLYLAVAVPTGEAYLEHPDRVPPFVLFQITPNGPQLFNGKLIPWRSSSTGNLIGASAFGPAALPPSGTYHFALLAAPANSSNPLEKYYCWMTSFVVQ